MRLGTALMTVSLLALPTHASAAWLLCEAMLTTDAAAGANELEAKRNALAEWTMRAGTHGVAYTRWQLAWNRRLTCDAHPGGGHRCVARGRPCRVSQTPPPPGAERLKVTDP